MLTLALPDAAQEARPAPAPQPEPTQREFESKPVPHAEAQGFEPTVDPGPIFSFARDALIVADVDAGRIRYWNPAAEALLGHAARQAIGQPVELFLPTPVARLYHERVAHFARSGDLTMLNAGKPSQAMAIAADGSERSVEMSLAPLAADRTGEPPHVLITLRDASHLQRLERQAADLVHLETARAALAARLEARARVLDSSARDVRLELARLCRAAASLRRLCARHAVADERQDRAARLARVVELRGARVQRGLDLLEDLAAIHADGLALDLERVNLVPLVGGLAARLRARTSAHRVNVAGPQGLTTPVDARRLEQALEDLVEMAIRRNPRGCWLDLDLRRPLVGLARIEVRDYGRRLSARERAALPGESNPDGTWRRIEHLVARHNGTLAVERPAEGGLRVSITLPTNGSRLSGGK